MSTQKNIRELSRFLSDRWTDWSCDMTSKAQFRFTLRRDGKSRLVFASNSPSDRYALDNIKRDLRRAMADLSGKPSETFK
jgi:hypothetical protein